MMEEMLPGDIARSDQLISVCKEYGLTSADTNLVANVLITLSGEREGVLRLAAALAENMADIAREEGNV